MGARGPPHTLGQGREVASRPSLDSPTDVGCAARGPLAQRGQEAWKLLEHGPPHVPQKMSTDAQGALEGGKAAWGGSSPPGRAQSGRHSPPAWAPRSSAPILSLPGGSEPRVAPARKGRARQSPGAAWVSPPCAQKAPHGWSEQNSVSPCTGCGLRHQPLFDLHWARVSQGFQNQCRWESRGGPSGPVLPRPGDLEPALLSVLERERQPARRSHGAGSAELPGGRPATDRPHF